MTDESKAEPTLTERVVDALGIEPLGNLADYHYDDWLDYFRMVPARKLLKASALLQEFLPLEGFAAASRWLEIIKNPSKMDKLYQGRLKAGQRESIMDLAIGDDDEAFYEALIRETVAKLDESNNSAQEVARMTQNLNIFRQELREIRARTPKKGTVLEKVLEQASKPPKAPRNAKKGAKTAKKKTTTKKASKK